LSLDSEFRIIILFFPLFIFILFCVLDLLVVDLAALLIKLVLPVINNWNLAQLALRLLVVIESLLQIFSSRDCRLRHQELPGYFCIFMLNVLHFSLSLIDCKRKQGHVFLFNCVKLLLMFIVQGQCR